MKLRLTILLFVVAAGFAHAQDSQPAPSRWAIYGSAGPNFYLNNFDKFKQYVDSRNFSFSARIMWEPEHRLSLGVKTGYYYIYRVRFPGALQSKFTLTAVPIHTIVTMKLYKGLYSSFGMGPTLYFNDIEAGGKQVISSSWISLADVTVNLGYHWKRPGKKFSYGGEFDYLHSSKSNENLLTIGFVARFGL